MSARRPEGYIAEDPHAQLEKTFIEEYLRERGYSPKKLRKMPAQQAQQLLSEASTYASTKLCAVEARAHFVNEIHGAGTPY